MADVVRLADWRPGDPIPRTDPPRNLEAEQALLGAMLGRNRCVQAIAEIVKAQHFADPINGHIFASILRKVDAGQVADGLTLRDEYLQRGVLEEVGGMDYLSRLVAVMAPPQAEADYARAVFDCWLRRQLIEAAEGLIVRAHGAKQWDATDDVLTDTVAKLEALAARVPDRRGPVMWDEGLDNAVAHAEAAHRGEIALGFSTGFSSLDEPLGGLERRNYTVLGARPSMGKTALALQIAEAVARAGQGGVEIVSMEMSATALARRAIARVAGISVVDLKRGNISGRAERLVLARKELLGLPISIDDARGQDMRMIRRKVRAARRRFGRLALVVVDHLHIVKVDEADRRNPTTAVGNISHELCALAEEEDCHVLALAQLSRTLLGRDDKRPNMGDLRQAGDIEQDADNIMFLHREEMFLPKSEPTQNTGETIDKHQARCEAWRQAKARARGRAEVILDKFREGATRTIELEFCGETTSFKDRLSAEQIGVQGALSDWEDRYFGP